MLPGHLVSEFWDTVEDHLVHKHRVTPPTARRGIARYRDELASHGVDDMIYHREPEVVADAIHVSFIKG